jgi:PAS domain S-box-containing protein
MTLLFDPTAILESIADSLFVLDGDGRFAFVNSEAAEFLGLQGDELLGKKFSEVLREENNSELSRAIEASLRDRSSRRLEHFHEATNSWLEQQICLNKDGGIAVLGRDITSRRRLEDALRASEERFRRLTDSNVIGVMVTTGGVVTEANDLLLSMIGYTRDELVRQQVTWRSIALPDHHVLDSAAQDDLRSVRFSRPQERDFVRKDGSLIPVVIASTRIDAHPNDCDAESWEVLSVVHDLSRRKHAERRLRHLVEATKILSSSLDVDKTLHELARFLVSEIGIYCAVYMQENGTLYRAASASRGAGNEGPDLSGTPQMDNVLTRGRSEVIEGVGILVPLPARGRIVGALFLSPASSTIDYDDFHFLEEVGRRAGITLENTRLYKQMESASRLKDEFVGALSHELRTPLTPILGGVYMLRAEPEDKRIFNKALDLIERNARVQSKIVEDLLDVSRIISGNFRIRQDPVELEAAINGALEAVKSAAEAKKIVIESKLAPLNGIIYGDVDRLRQVFWNILSNAVKFTHNGGHVQVELLQKGDHAEVHIRDNGIGIAGEFLPYVFHRFSREDTSRTRVHNGLGVGLAIVQHLVESHGGTVHAHSFGDGKGATFVVKLPLRAAMTQETRTRSAGITG